MKVTHFNSAQAQLQPSALQLKPAATHKIKSASSGNPTIPASSHQQRRVVLFVLPTPTATFGEFSYHVGRKGPNAMYRKQSVYPSHIALAHLPVISCASQTPREVKPFSCILPLAKFRFQFELFWVGLWPGIGAPGLEILRDARALIPHLSSHFMPAHLRQHQG